jgi:ketosteroid isomerase-like protein
VTSQQSKNVVAAAFEGWVRGDGDFFSILADDVSWTITGSSPVAGTYTSRQEFIERAIQPISARLSQPIRPNVQRIITEGDTVVVLWSGHAVAADGGPYDNRYCWVMRLVDGKVKEATAFFDSPALTDLFERVKP